MTLAVARDQGAIVLIVEDEKMLRASIVRGLSKLEGVHVREAGTVSEAVSVIDETTPRLIISDIDLPDGTGIELVEVLDRRHLNIPLYFTSAYVARYHGAIPMRSNVRVREKPVPLRELREIVTSQLAKPESTHVDPPPFAASDYVQLACMARKSVVVMLVREGADVGRVLVSDGEIWSARDDHGVGEPALRRLLFGDGMMARCIGAERVDEPRSIDRPWEMVLLEAARQHDEGVEDDIPEPVIEEVELAADDGSAASDVQIAPAVDAGWDSILDDEDVEQREQREQREEPAVARQPDNRDEEIVFEYQKREQRLREYEAEQSARQRRASAGISSAPAFSESVPPRTPSATTPSIAAPSRPARPREPSYETPRVRTSLLEEPAAQRRTSGGPLTYARVRFTELYEAGVEALLSRDYEAALWSFREARALDPENPQVRANLARLADLGYSEP
ncbi:MAG: response regulator [Myxococcales bacterium]|nr:response regulator [Myxococcales bacterium]